MKLKTPQQRAAISGFILVVVGLVFLRVHGYNNTVLRSSKLFADALVKADSATLASFAPESELKSYGVSRSSLQALIKNRGLPSMKQNFDLSAILILQQTDHVEIYIPPKHGSALSSGVKYIFTSGFETVEPISYCFNWFNVDSSRFLTSTGNPSIDTLNSFIRKIDAEQQYYESLGFRGIYSQASSRLETWQERRAAFVNRLTKL